MPCPGLSPHTARLAAGPLGRECLTLTGGYGWVGGFRRGKEPRAGVSSPVSSLETEYRPPGSQGRGGAVGAWKGAGERS